MFPPWPIRNPENRVLPSGLVEYAAGFLDDLDDYIRNAGKDRQCDYCPVDVYVFRTDPMSGKIEHAENQEEGEDPVFLFLDDLFP